MCGDASWAGLAGVGPQHAWAVTFWDVLSRGLFAFLVFILFTPRPEGNGCWAQSCLVDVLLSGLEWEVCTLAAHLSGQTHFKLL